LSRAQTAIEYLTSYGWMILIVVVVITALFAFGIFNPSSHVSNSCTMPASFSCQGISLAQNGGLYINLTQNTGDPINITAISCDATQSTRNAEVLTPPVYLGSGDNASFVMQCYTNSSTFSGTYGSVYHGYLIVNYTDLVSSFQYTSVGVVVAKVSANSIAVP